LDVKWSSLINMGVIGEGTFGTVYLMENKLDHKKYALKVTNYIHVLYLYEREKNRLLNLHDIIPSFFFVFLVSK
jgi:serine/threonine protein kinase